MKVISDNGIEYEINEDALDDMDLLDALIDLDEGNLSGLRKAIVMLLGDDGKKKLYESNRKENGRVSARAVLADFKAIVTKAGKNS